MKISEALWWGYGHTYDGLLGFYPYRELVRTVVDRANVREGELVLDLGCGTANQLAIISKLTSSPVHGVDGSPTMINIARRKLDPSKSVFEVRDLIQFLQSAPSSKYDVILCTNVVYAMSDRDEFWKHLLRVLRPNGRAIIATAISTDSKPLIREQLKREGILRSLKPKLIGVFLFDSMINLFGRSGHFEFPKEAVIRSEIDTAGGLMSATEPCYSGIDIVFTVTRT